MARVVKDRISDWLKNIDGLLVRNEFKVRIYADYFLSSIHFMFTVHDPKC